MERKKISEALHTTAFKSYKFLSSIVFIIMLPINILASLPKSIIHIILKNSSVWDITPYSPLKINRHFGTKCRLHRQCRIMNQARNQRESRWQTEFWFFIIIPWRWRRQVPPKLRLTFNGLNTRRYISQNSSKQPLWEPQILHIILF
jgi:hypothetical protein